LHFNSSEFIDISPVISSRIGVFPGDVKFERAVSLDFKKGDHLLLSSIQTSLHLGAHADGPNHYVADGKGIGERPLELYMGKTLVIHGEAKRGERVGLKHLAPRWQNAQWPAKRILVKTGSFPDPDQWNSDFCSLEPELIELWAKAGVKLIGIDTPSIDPETAKELKSHHMVARHDLAILEGLVLDEVQEGLYTMVALPLRIENADAAPVRAILFKNPDLLPY
jgi:arylformamidase